MNLLWTKGLACSRRFLSVAGLGLSLFTVLVVLLNHPEVVTTLDPFFRVAVPTLCLAFGLLTSLFSTRLGIMACLFALPLTPNFAFQLQAFTGYGRVGASHNGGLDLIAGFCLGMLLNRLLRRREMSRPVALPWPVGLVMVFLTLSVALAITRNLHQTTSVFEPSVLVYNLLHLRSIDWHDDYRPLFDWVAYGCAFTFIGLLVPALKAIPDRNDVVFKPLICGLVIAAIVGIFQSQIGIGLMEYQVRFRPDRLGFIALGLQPDIHAYAGHMLIGAVGLFGYARYVNNKTYRLALFALVIPLSWFGLLLSKSKSSFAIGLAFLLAMMLIWTFRHARHLNKVLLGLGVALLLLVLSAVSFREPWLAVLTDLAHKLGFKNLAEVNVALVYRPENFVAATRMFLLFPLLGLGQSEFYRQAANHQLTQSYFLSIEQNGENAHNYFLQTIAETGLIGAMIFTLMLVYPLWKISDKRLLIPAAVGLLSVFAGNLFAHSMLVRENLFVAAGFLALMYAWVASEQSSTLNTMNTVNTTALPPGTKKPVFSSRRPSAVWFLVIFVVSLCGGALAAREVYRSFSRFPFTFDTQCYKSKPLDRDGWMTGLFEVGMASGTHRMTFQIKGLPPDIAQHPLAATLSIVRGESDVLVSRQLVLTQDGPAIMDITLPDDRVVDSPDYRAVVSLQKCFIPRNMGINADARRLGIQIGATRAD